MLDIIDTKVRAILNDEAKLCRVSTPVFADVVRVALNNVDEVTAGRMLNMLERALHLPISDVPSGFYGGGDLV